MTVHSINKPKYAANLNDKAFTLIEVLIALSIFSVLAFFMMPIFQILLNSNDSKAELQTMEWEVFCSQIKKEIRLSTKAQVISGRLILTKDADTIQYEKYDSDLRRRVNSTGHEILLQNVAQYSFTIQNNSVKVTVKDLSGKDYSVIAYSLVTWNAAP
ncbi:competence type IV pilus minor pilin ComGF [Neobacillus sp. NRS-1170]|uniref:competence type IV pilus minor pilin ComGF n=1 Tax=Neobacillus sp. NRS-1170 TaxID=3233898 RepID=UPI003D2B2231